MWGGVSKIVRLAEIAFRNVYTDAAPAPAKPHNGLQKSAEIFCSSRTLTEPRQLLAFRLSAQYFFIRAPIFALAAALILRPCGFPSPTTIAMTFEGVTQSVAFAAGDEATDTYSWAVVLVYERATLVDANFEIADLTQGGSAIGCLGNGEGPDYESCGTFSFPGATAAPEPSSIALMLAGIGLLLVMRKRIGQGLPQAS